MRTEASAQRCTMSGIVVEKDGTPVEAAVVLLPESNLWGVTSGSGEFIIRNVGKGKVTAEVSCLGYATARYEIDLQSDTTGLEFLLLPDNLMLDQVVVTAQENSSSATTSHTIDRTAIDHVQMMDVSSLMGLLPGGKTTDPDLASASPQRFEIRSGGEAGASFGTAVDGYILHKSENQAIRHHQRIQSRGARRSPQHQHGKDKGRHEPRLSLFILRQEHNLADMVGHIQLQRQTAQVQGRIRLRPWDQVYRKHRIHGYGNRRMFVLTNDKKGVSRQSCHAHRC